MTDSEPYTLPEPQKYVYRTMAFIAVIRGSTVLPTLGFR